MPARGRMRLQRGDVQTLIGLPDKVKIASEAIGYPDRHTQATDMLILGFGNAIGCFSGAISTTITDIPVSLSISGGKLLAGLFLGWLRNRHPTFGRIPGPVIWLFDKLGLHMFIAVIGISSGEHSYMPCRSMEYDYS